MNDFLGTTELVLTVDSRQLKIKKRLRLDFDFKARRKMIDGLQNVPLNQWPSSGPSELDENSPSSPSNCTRELQYSHVEK